MEVGKHKKYLFRNIMVITHHRMFHSYALPFTYPTQRRCVRGEEKILQFIASSHMSADQLILSSFTFVDYNFWYFGRCVYSLHAIFLFWRKYRRPLFWCNFYLRKLSLVRNFCAMSSQNRCFFYFYAIFFLEWKFIVFLPPSRNCLSIIILLKMHKSLEVTWNLNSKFREKWHT